MLYVHRFQIQFLIEKVLIRYASDICKSLKEKENIRIKMPLEWLFGRRMTPEEMLRKNQRTLNKAMRDLDREKSHMEQQEKKLIADIKKTAKDGQMVGNWSYNLSFLVQFLLCTNDTLQESVKIMAKDLVRTRRYIKKFTLMKANIQGVSLKIQTLRSQNAMAGAMRGVTRAMQSMNRLTRMIILEKISSHGLISR